MKKKLAVAGLVILCIVFLAIIIGGASLRKELPYEFEIVPVKNGIGIINTTFWNQRDLVVSWSEKGEGRKGSMVLEGAVNQCVIDNLASGRTYAVQIKRADPVGRLLYKPFQDELTLPEAEPQYVVLVGASVGKSWDLPSLAERTDADGFAFGYRGHFGYDKGQVINALAKDKIKPDTVIIKECAAYFPKEIEPTIAKLPGWVDILNASEITPMLATCCPVTEENAKQNPGRIETIQQYNQFIRTYAAENGLKILDLERTLRKSDLDPHLNKEYAQSDGLHLSPKAYNKLDELMTETLAAKVEPAF